MVVSLDDKNKEEVITQLEKEKAQAEKSLGNREEDKGTEAGVIIIVGKRGRTIFLFK